MALLAVLPLRVRSTQPSESLGPMAARAVAPHERWVRQGRRSPRPGPSPIPSRGQPGETVARDVLVRDQRAGRLAHHVALRTALVRRVADLRSHAVAQLHPLAVAGQTAGDL